MGAFVDRLVKRTVLVCAALAVCAFMANHHSHPCTDHQRGAGGMCVTVSAGGTR